MNRIDILLLHHDERRSQACQSLLRKEDTSTACVVEDTLAELVNSLSKDPTRVFQVCKEASEVLFLVKQL